MDALINVVMSRQGNEVLEKSTASTAVITAIKILIIVCHSTNQTGTDWMFVFSVWALPAAVGRNCQPGGILTAVPILIHSGSAGSHSIRSCYTLLLFRESTADGIDG